MQSLPLFSFIRHFPHRLACHNCVPRAPGLKGGYAWNGRGIMSPTPRSPDFLVRFFLNITAYSGASSMYFINMGGCWKLDGRPCDGNTTTDVTRYALMDTGGPLICSAAKQTSCPPYHTFINGSKVLRNNTEHFPYAAYKWFVLCDRHEEIHALCVL